MQLILASFLPLLLHQHQPLRQRSYNLHLQHLVSNLYLGSCRWRWKPAFLLFHLVLAHQVGRARSVGIHICQPSCGSQPFMNPMLQGLAIPYCPPPATLPHHWQVIQTASSFHIQPCLSLGPSSRPDPTRLLKVVTGQGKLLFSQTQIQTRPSPQVSQYLVQQGVAERHAKVFFDEEIDGAGLLVLQRHDVLRGLGIKLGPALKIYNRVLALQTRRRMDS